MLGNNNEQSSRLFVQMLNLPIEGTLLPIMPDRRIAEI